MRTIITAWEAVKYGPVQRNFPTGYLCNHIKRTELRCFNKCWLGKTFYEKLIADLTPIDKAEVYDVNKTYQEGDLICYDECILISCENDNNDHPDDNKDSWKPARKFKSNCYQDLWECHLRYWLAFKIIYTSIRYTTYQAGAKGLGTIKDDDTGFTSASEKGLSEFKKEIAHDAADELENMYDHMVEKHKCGSCDYSCIDKVKTACGEEECQPPKKARRRRFHFKN